jgi:hypothetical protein
MVWGRLRNIRQLLFTHFKFIFLLLRTCFLQHQNVRRGILHLHFHIKENNNARNIVYNTFFFPFPAQVALSNYCFGCLFRILCFKVRLHDLSHVFIVHELPHTVTGYHNKFIFFAQVHFQDF